MDLTVCILVGDHYQLPPLVQSSAAQQNGLGISLFKRLCDLHPETAVCELGIQYRMCSDIMLLANTLVYDNKLRCADEQTARNFLKTDRSRANKSNTEKAGVLPFMRRVQSPATKVLFLDTCRLGSMAYETRASSSICNNFEAKLINQICDSFVDAGVAEGDIGVVAPYNAQLDSLSGILSDKIELLTADRFQGRDKPCILITFTRSNSEGIVGSLLSDLHRLNVALTRAKSKLILIGNSETLSKATVLADLLAILRKKSWVVGLSEEDGQEISNRQVIRHGEEKLVVSENSENEEKS